jgi:hypothetical protein
MNSVKYEIQGLTVLNEYDNEKNRFLRFINNTNKKLKIYFFCYYPSIKVPFFKVERDLNPHTWFQPENKFIKGAGFIELFIDEVFVGKINLLFDLNLKKVSEKVICVGLNKTGTTSLTENMSRLGFQTWGTERGQFSHDFLNFYFSNNAIGNIIDVIEKTDADFFQDIPFSCPRVSNRIINFFPQSKYILTVRENVDVWVKSVKKFWHPFFQNDRINLNPLSVNSLALNGVYKEYSYLTNFFETWRIDDYQGSLDEKLRQVYITHNESVKSTLITNNCDWIEIDVSRKAELKKLTTWLNIDNEEEDFVWVNKTKG